MLHFNGERWVRRLLMVVVAAEFVLLGLDYLINFFDVFGDISIRRIFNIAREQSIPTFFASVQAAAVGATALLHAALDRRGGTSSRGWTLVGILWIYFGIDDNAEMHERIGAAIERAAAQSSFVAGFPSFAWQLFVGPVLGLALLSAVVFAWRRVSNPSRWLLVACLVGFAVAQGLDFLEGIEGFYVGLAADWGRADYTVSHGARAIEEMLEMLATTAFWAPTLWLLAARLRGKRLEFG